MVQGVKDTTCKNDKSRKLEREIGHAVSMYTEMEEWSHMEFVSEITSDEYYEMLSDQLEYVRISRTETVQKILDYVVETSDRKGVEKRIDRVQNELMDFEEDVSDTAHAFQEVQESFQALSQAVDELFMRDRASYVQAGSALVAAAVAMAAF